ncbi:MAG: glutamine--fructose-6-phosphate transaminase (isomerizing) [Bacilli bacterium]
MCGIIGYNGNNKSLPILIDGLKRLEYRGYDSAGIAYLENQQLNIIKRTGKITNLEKSVNCQNNSTLGIAHTRWATHGCPNENNAHPHQCGDITIVHNGIIENYEELKLFLIDKGYNFKSDTDTEIACAMINHLYQQNHDIVKTIHQCQKLFKGSYALGILVKGDNKLYCTRKDSPLVIGIGKQENFIASDIPAFLDKTNKYILLEENDIGIIEPNKITLYDQNLNLVKRKINECNIPYEQMTKNGYDHYMLKEIHEQPTAIKNTLGEYLNDDLDKLITKIPSLQNYESIDIVACGSAYHTGLIAKTLIENYAEIPVNVDVASEYRYKKMLNKDHKLVILVSQSGETADTLACLRLAKENNVDTLSIVNVVNSTIDRESNLVLYTKAGPEIAVATTKAYSAQVAMLSLLALNLAKENIDTNTKKEIRENIRELPNLMEQIINRDYHKIAMQIYEKESMFFIGRLVDYALAMEGSLKIKEISYIHSEAYAAGELKHGTISLIEDGTPVVGIITDDNVKAKTISNIKEVKARGAKTIIITNDNIDNELFDFVIKIPKINEFLQPLLTVLPLQMIAYETAKLRGCDIDKPKNLAKSVTVE